MRSHIATSWILAIALCAGLASQVHAASVSIGSPAEDREYQGAVKFSAEVAGFTGTVVVQLEYAGVTHYMLAEADANGRATVHDNYLPAVDGPAPLQISLLPLTGWEPLAQAKRSVLTRKAEPVWVQQEIAAGSESVRDRRDFVTARNWIASSANKLRQEWLAYCSWIGTAEQTNDSKHWRSAAEHGEQYANARCFHFHDRIAQYGIIAETSLDMGQIGEALKAAHEADRIYEGEKAQVSSGPRLTPMPIAYRFEFAQDAPKHFRVFARLSILQGQTEAALQWLAKERAFYEAQAGYGHLAGEQRRRCLAHAEDSCRDMAGISMLLDRDHDAYRRWMAEVANVRAVAPDGPGAH